ncbi:hypothetical protein [Pararhizobium sp.]|uniref:hypothetical protein n=1 Tax=Pararhizobium sp. TaxID=1977563 RepID=UPI003BACD00C
MTYYALYHPEQDGTQFRLVVEPTTVVTELSGFSPEGPEHYSMRAGFFSSIDEAVVAVCAETGLKLDFKPVSDGEGSICYYALALDTH